MKLSWRSRKTIFCGSAARYAESLRLSGFGSHGELQGLGVHWEMWAWLVAKGGMSNHDVLRSATMMGAEAIGLKQELGSLEPGKLVDLIVLDKYPLTNIRHTNSTRRMMKNGELFAGDTLNQLWPQQKAAISFW